LKTGEAVKARTPQEPTVADSTLAQLTDRYRQLLEQVGGLGFIASGNLTGRYRACRTPGCRCTTDPPRLHGPYWQHTRKVAGKTITTQLTPEQAERYQEWIINRRRLNELVADMKEISEQARKLLLAQLPSPHTGR
jgi:hypothetical protein